MCPPVGIEIKNDVDLFSDNISGKERNKEGSSGSNNGKIGFVYNLTSKRQAIRSCHQMKIKMVMVVCFICKKSNFFLYINRENSNSFKW